MTNRGLGKGINAFFPSQKEDESVKEIPVKELRPNPYQPRKVFNAEAIEELSTSIKTFGVLQPLIVRQSIKGYEIVVGERRYRASLEAGLKTVPAVVKELTDRKMMEIALIENLQRENLNPIEEAIAYQKLMKETDVTQEELSSRLGKSRSHLANFLRLLQLPDEVQEYISEGKLTMGHGRAILGLKKKEARKALADRVLKEKLNVRQLEQLITQLNQNVSRETKKDNKPDPFLKAKENSLRERFGTSVSIKKSKKKGKIEIEFFSEEDLNRILEVLEKEDN
ncbi:ParB/RepB/Spo0J family partition protein [Pseudalkalibacillus hwajinpoensis]|uniref:ParB/RepB/Spo0J family partition protein n=1 Tax=Guptibacillus hwajinpoensis TaxID=208199 RepID=A0A4U1MA36_9BACL|nr:ParB/RepB/Spo0J family partition protein [Pseudalkalibacillus hwajinpoensis]TKD67657.1 ParB/RepB/Spo0J family partition protein [Pseudalkalibacillus hwajinpoensis]